MDCRVNELQRNGLQSKMNYRGMNCRVKLIACRVKWIIEGIAE